MCCDLCALYIYMLYTLYTLYKTIYELYIPNAIPSSEDTRATNKRILTPLRALTAVLNASRAGAASRRRIGRNGSVRA